MRFFSTLIIAASLAIPTVWAAPTQMLSVEKFSGATSGKYIVKFKKGIARKDWYSKLNIDSAKMVDWDMLNGFASTFLSLEVSSYDHNIDIGDLDTDTLNTLRASSDVESISEDGIMHTMTTQYVRYNTVSIRR